MAKVLELGEGYAAWLAALPANTRVLAERLPPDRLYRMKSTGQRGTISSYSNNGTVSFTVDGTWSLVAFARNVFGVSPEDLEECDLPSEAELRAELRGVIFNDQETEDFINSARALNGLPPITLRAAIQLGEEDEDETIH